MSLDLPFLHRIAAVLPCQSYILARVSPGSWALRLVAARCEYVFSHHLYHCRKIPTF